MAPDAPPADFELYSHQASRKKSKTPKKTCGFWKGLCSFFQAFTDKKHNISYWCFFLMTEFILEVVVDKQGIWSCVGASSIFLPMILANYLQFVKALIFFRGLTLFCLLISIVFIATTIAMYFFIRKSFNWLVKYVFQGAMVTCGCLLQYHFITDAIPSKPSSKSGNLGARMVTVDNQQKAQLLGV